MPGWRYFEKKSPQSLFFLIGQKNMRTSYYFEQCFSQIVFCSVLSPQFLTETLHSTFYTPYPLCSQVKFNWSTEFPTAAQNSLQTCIWNFPFLDFLHDTGFTSNKHWWHSRANRYPQNPNIIVQYASATPSLRLLVRKPPMSSWESCIQKWNSTWCSHLDSRSCWLRTLLRGDLWVYLDCEWYYFLHRSIPLRRNQENGIASARNWRPHFCRSTPHRDFQKCSILI